MDPPKLIKIPVPQLGLQQPRILEEVRSLAVAVQANLVQLRVETQRRKIDSLSTSLSDIAAPGVVRQFRETLVDRQVIKNYTDLELLLQLHEFWGQFCAINWLLSDDANAEEDSGDGSTELATLKCETSVRLKLAETHAFAWRFRLELDRRRSSVNDIQKRQEYDTSLADQIPASAFGKPVERLSESELMLTICEHVGLLCVFRWALDNQSNWLDPSLSVIDDDPFPDANSDT